MKKQEKIKIVPLCWQRFKGEGWRGVHSEEQYETEEAARDGLWDGWEVRQVEASKRVWRLNTLPDADEPFGRALLEEIKWKVRVFGVAVLGWTCMGHTRTHWQSVEACERLKALLPECDVSLDVVEGYGPEGVTVRRK